MIYYLLRRVIYAIPTLIGINVITFALFFMVNSPDDMARMQLGQKYVKQAEIEQWKQVHGYDEPLFYNAEESGVEHLTQTLFFQKSLRLFLFDFGISDAGRDIGYDISHRMWPSLAIALPTFVIGLLLNIVFAMVLSFFRASYLDWGGVVFKFIILPVMVAVLAGLGSGARWYRTLFLDELTKDYVKTARAKGLSEVRVLFRHVLKNAMLPILTGVVVIIPSLFMGSLVLESFFGIPGLGNYIIEAIHQQDFAIVRAMVFLGSILYILGLILTDLAYTWADPRIRVGAT